MNKMLLTPRWLIAAAVCVLLCTLLVGGERVGADRDDPRGSGHRVADPE